MSEKQRTLKSAFSLSGVGLHTGENVEVTIEPAPANHGYKFQRIDVEGEPIIPADADLVVDTQRGTTLEKNGVKVCTTEHLLSALYGLQVDNALIKLTGPEIPIVDGSALPFVKEIERVGFQEQDAENNDGGNQAIANQRQFTEGYTHHGVIKESKNSINNESKDCRQSNMARRTHRVLVLVELFKLRLKA